MVLLNDEYVRAVVDTGTTHSVFPKELADRLGIDLDDGPVMSSGGGPVITWQSNVRLEIPELELRVSPLVLFAEGRRPPLLGLVGFLDRVIFGLQHSQSRVFLAADRTDP